MVDSTPVKYLNAEEGNDLGLRLKFVREHNGLSQRELAKKAGVPHSSISMIEQGTNSPSINSLTKILNGIPMSLAQFFMCDLELLSQQIFRANELGTSEKVLANGSRELLIPVRFTSTDTQFKRMTFSAGWDSGATPLLVGKAFSGYITQGEIELSINADVVVLSEGDSFYLLPNQPHRLRNLSVNAESVIILCEA